MSGQFCTLAMFLPVYDVNKPEKIPDLFQMIKKYLIHKSVNIYDVRQI